MVPDEQAKYAALDEWFNTPQGMRVAQAFTAELSIVNEKLSGKRLLQLGCCGNNDWLSMLHFRQKWIVSPALDHTPVMLNASMNALPIERNSMDCVLAPLTLELFARGRSPVDEIDRILKPMGFVIFLGINPWSFWGAALRFKHAGTLRSSLLVKRAILSRGYRQCFLSSFYYIPPIKSEKLIHKLEFLNEMGKMMWPYPAGFYCLIAQKYDACMTPLQFEIIDDLDLARA